MGEAQELSGCRVTVGHTFLEHPFQVEYNNIKYPAARACANAQADLLYVFLSVSGP